jgi:hypothetical protein
VAVVLIRLTVSSCSRPPTWQSPEGYWGPWGASLEAGESVSRRPAVREELGSPLEPFKRGKVGGPHPHALVH